MTTKAHDLYDLALRDHDMLPVLCYGTAGTGKTYGALKAAVEALQAKRVRKIIVARPNVSFAETMGFLPGDVREKLGPWVANIEDILLELGVGKAEQQAWEKAGRLMYVPLEHIQGRTFHESFIVLDECQNMSYEQYKVFLTRIGRWSKMVICGDIAQTSPKFKQGGLATLLQMFDATGFPIHTIHMTLEDVVRSEQCKRAIEAFENWEAK